ncbi:MAG: methylaspartate mutase subunit S [Chloroflexi bacterium]|nr:methylaspartate mutase subunit S [Chloroflexota bacterium]
MEKPTIVLGSLMDIHSVGLRVLGYALQDDFQVVYAGTMLTQEEMINAAIETNARAILVSSLYGHAELDCQGFKQKCLEAGLKDTLLYLGGNLVVGAERRSFEEIAQVFKKMGFDRVYPQDVAPEDVLADLRSDLNI